MGKSDKSGGSAGIGFVGLLQLVFIVLKFLNVIAWPWYLVLLPLEIEGALLILALIFLVWIKNK